MRPRLIPASWTGLELPADGQAGDGPGTLGSVADLLGLSVLVSALSARSRDDREQAARKPPAREDDRAACSDCRRVELRLQRGAAGSSPSRARASENMTSCMLPGESLTK